MVYSYNNRYVTPYMAYGADEFQFGWDLFKSVGHFISNAAKTVGRAVDKAEHTIQDAEGFVTHEISKIPIIGGPIAGIYDSYWHIMTAPLEVIINVATGSRIDRAVLAGLKEEATNIKEIGPYATMVVATVPGIGTGVAAVMGAGFALADGQPIDDALINGVVSAIPGGPAAKAAFNVAHAIVKAAIEGQKIDPNFITATAVGAGADAIGLPTAAKNSLIASSCIVASLAQGKPLATTLINGAADGLPIPAQAKDAIKQAGDIVTAIAGGQKVDKALLQRASNIAKILDDAGAVDLAIKAGSSVEGPLQAAMGDSLIKGANLPKPIHDALHIGLATGVAVVRQVQAAHQITDVIPGKLTQAGIQLAKTLPVVQAARKLADKGTKGFDLAQGICQSQTPLYDIVKLRDTLSDADKMGYDMGLASHIGMVTHPSITTLSPSARAGHVITVGMQGMGVASNKQAIMKAIVKNPNSAIGAAYGIHEIAQAREEWYIRLLHYLGFTLGHNHPSKVS